MTTHDKDDQNGNQKKSPCKRLKKILEDLAFYEGEFLDYWSIVHFSTGFLLGLILNWIGFSILEAFFITAFVLTFWEVVEPSLYKILRKFFPSLPPFSEKTSNTLIDIVVGMLGFILAKLIDILLNSLLAGELITDFSLEVPDSLTIFRAIIILIPLTMIFIPTRLMWQGGGPKRASLNKKTATKAFCKKIENLIEKVKKSGLSDEEKRKIIDDLKKAEELVEGGKFSEAVKLIDELKKLLPKKGNKEIKEDLDTLSTWALLMNVKNNWKPEGDSYGIKSFSVECNKDKKECFIVLVLIIPNMDEYKEAGDEIIQEWKTFGKVTSIKVKRKKKYLIKIVIKQKR
jgi:hypothetical protein